ncbi:MAG: hypothetical protein KF841_03475 [Phycisphaerae bacterium]|nr:hypothetical protein [Phycisphaerae bacterium]
MIHAPSRTAPLEGLSRRQRAIVERHLPLVRLTIRRHSGLARRDRDCRDPAELFQEGCLALVEAVRSHEADRHGAFASFAMSRIHFAISRYAHEQCHPIRMPFISQRRERNRANTLTYCASDCRPEEVVRPVVVQYNDTTVAYPDEAGAAAAAAKDARSHDVPIATVGDLVRERLHEAVQWSVAELCRGSRSRAKTLRLVRRCLAERWMVPEPSARASLRELAGALSCSVGRITHTEARFRRIVSRKLLQDDEFVALTRLARVHPAGMKRPVWRDELFQLRSEFTRNRKADPRGPWRDDGSGAAERRTPSSPLE